MGSVLNDDSECPGRGSRTPAVRARSSSSQPAAVGSAAGRPGWTVTRSDKSLGSDSKHPLPRRRPASLAASGGPRVSDPARPCAWSPPAHGGAPALRPAPRRAVPRATRPGPAPRCSGEKGGAGAGSVGALPVAGQLHRAHREDEGLRRGGGRVVTRRAEA